MTDTTKRTFESFGYEWNTFDDVRPEDAEFARTYFRDLDMASLHGRTGLDAGCGKGRYTRFLAPHLARLVALDGSRAVEAAARNLAPYPNTFVVRADLRAAPFAPGSFGFVASLGVLHHLDDPGQGLHALAELLAPGGKLLLYLYSRPPRFGARRTGLALAGLLRKATVRMPHRLLRPFSAAVAALLWVLVVGPGAWAEGRRMHRLAALPMSAYRGKPFRSLVLDTFDRLSAPVERRYLWGELAPLFAEEGLVVDATRDEAGWFVLLHKPEGVPPA